MDNYKRQYRELDDLTKRRISLSLTGKVKSEEHKQHISQGLKRYWNDVPSEKKEETTIEDIML